MTLCHSYIDSNPFDQLILNPLTCFRDTIADWFGCFQLFSPLTTDFLDGVFIEPALVVWVIHWFIDSWSIDPSLTRCFCIIDALSMAHWLIDSGYFASLHWIIVVVSLSHWWVVSLVHWNIEPCSVGFIDPTIGSVLCGFDSLTHRCIDSDPLLVQSD